ncbi:hypothetical protein CPLU01_00870 [Colletotrichum plurivorum]|uniref:Uncharacterized protein n=1 Tax=Colletotrichum plurivorum TaxID=2175906 RepID=A0A8H6NQW1_9PEZI|nr:hypothetical protein CPLU01_00870 [Colletotrichum plurivorum]
MKTTCFLAALLGLTNAQATPAVTSSARQFFIYDSHPTGSLEASIINYARQNATYEVACPSSNTVCKNEGYYPAKVTHQSGSLWIGTNTATAGVTKRWECRLGNGSDDVLSDQYGVCSVTTVDGSTTKTDEPLPVNTCFVDARSVVVAITAGLEKVEAIHPIDTTFPYEASYWLSWQSEAMKTAMCKPFSSPSPTASPKTTASEGPATGATGSAQLPTETGTASGTASGAASEASPSQSTPPSGSSRTWASLPVVVVGVAVVGAALLL